MIPSWSQNKEIDCILYSEEGDKFNIHKEILYPTTLMKDILLSNHSGCCQNIEIFSPCSGKELECILNFLYNGSISSNEKDDLTKILYNLTQENYTMLITAKNVEIIKEFDILDQG